MIRQAPRLLLRNHPALRALPTRRFLSTAPPAQKSRSWKSSVVRWGLAIGAVYYYSTSNLFAEEPPCLFHYARVEGDEKLMKFPVAAPPQSPPEEIPLPTLESIAPSRRQKAAPTTPSTPSDAPSSSVSPNTTASPGPSMEETEAEASQEGAFNEETGEINWDCPCLGGMAHGPCGEQFRAAFSCFVYSKEDPKGMECIPNFKNMQDCFRQHPEIYGAELEEDEEEGELGGGDGDEDVSVGAGAGAEGEGEALPAAATKAAVAKRPAPANHALPDSSSADDTQRARKATDQVRDEHSDKASESDEMVPKAAFDATDATVAK